MKLLGKFLMLLVLPASASFGQAPVTEQDRYLELTTFQYHEPCVQFKQSKFKAEASLVPNDSTLSLLLTSEPQPSDMDKGCSKVSINPSSPNIVRYEVTDLIIAENGINTGLSYDVYSVADLSLAQPVIEIVKVNEIGPKMSEAMLGPSFMQFAGPTSFPFDYQEGEELEVTFISDYNGEASYSPEKNTVSLQIYSGNPTGDYTLTAVFKDPFLGMVDLRIDYLIEYTAPESQPQTDDEPPVEDEPPMDDEPVLDCGLLQIYSPLLEICLDI